MATVLNEVAAMIATEVNRLIRMLGSRENHRRCRSYQARLSVGTIAGQSTLYRPYTITFDRRGAEKEFYYDPCCCAHNHKDASQNNSQVVFGFGRHIGRFTCARNAD